MAIAPVEHVGHHALLLINPHTSFFFRSELQMVSEEGLNAYGAVTWGQFFIYQGFNERTGWMHTSSGVDAVDEYLETVEKKGDRFFYKYGNEERPVVAEQITVPYQNGHAMAEKKFTVYRTHHGPVIREANGKWVSIRLMQEPVKALKQSYSRTKAKDYKSYRQTMELKANSSNNTIFADADGDIAYFHGNFIPRRDTSFDWTKPVDGSNPATEWQGLLAVDETPHLLNPKSGWLYNTNNWPWSAAGPSSPKKEDYPAYVESGGESARGLHAIRVLENKKDFTLDSLIAAAYDSYLTWFEKPLPALIKAWDEAADANPLKAKLARADRPAAQVGPAVGGGFRPDFARRFLGRGYPPHASAEADAGRERRPTTPSPRRRRSNCCSRWRRRPTSSRRTSGAGRRRGAISIDSSASRATSCSRSTTRGRAFRWASRPRCGVRWPRSERARIRGRRNGTAPAGTASSRWWSSATGCGPRR